MALSAVAGALTTIGGFLIEEGKFLYGVGDQVEELRDELDLLRSYLENAIAKTHEEKRVRDWVSQANRLACKAEDIIEEYAIKVASKRGGGFIQVARRVACIVGELIAIYIFGNEIGKIKTKIVCLKNNLRAYGIDQISAQPSSETIDEQRRQRTTYSHEVDEYFVGMEDDVSKIVKWVAEDDKIRRVISIYGIGGLGKTTIARKVFNHIKKSSERSFDCFAWVSVSQQCQVKKLMKDILNQILGDKVDDVEETELVRKVYHVLKNKKYFVVLDDIWELDDWKSLRKAFPISEGSSKILVTTRKTDVAEVADRHSRHEPKLLDIKDGWDLLTKIAFNLQEGQGESLPETVKNVGINMLQKCDGLPLAISALGGILKRKDPSLTEWEKINKKFEKYLMEDGGVRSVLTMSYDDLPSYLKPCFLYMGCFKEDEEINSTRLYQLWMAEGLLSIRRNGLETLMGVASDFLHELVSRNMVQPIVISELTQNKHCRLHDLMRELCLTKGEEEEFMEVKNIQIRGEEVGSVSIDGASLLRQTILVDGKNKCKISIAELTRETCFRALIFNCGLQDRSFHWTFEGSIKFKSLRSLILDKCNFKANKLPNEIRDMIHLRYLSLRDSLADGKLPVFIGDLEYLQILDAHNYNLQLPNIFHKMKTLRCLYLPYVRNERKWWVKKLDFDGLNKLEVVEGLDSDRDEFPDLSKLVNLRRLKCSIGDYKCLSTTLEQLKSMSKMEYVSIWFSTKDSGSELENGFPDVKKLLLCPSLHTLQLWAPIGKFPRYEHHFWPDLVTLSLVNTKLEEDPMPFLQELPNLRRLWMQEDAYVGKEMYCSSKPFPKLTSLTINNIRNIEIWRVDAGAFPQLTYLFIGELPKMKKWRVDAGAFPNLSKLSIFNCSSIEEIVPDGLTSITTLTRIYMVGVPSEFKNRYGRVHNTMTAGQIN